MYSKLRYVLVFILVMAFCQGYAQQSETIEPAQSGVAKDIQYAPATPVSRGWAGRHEKGEQIQNKVFSKIDSLSNRSSNLLQTATDSLNNLSKAIEGKVQSKIDSLQQKLNEIQSSFAEKLRRTRKGNQKISNVTEKADKITRRIDSLQRVLSNKMGKLDKYGASVPGTDFAEKLNLPKLNSKSIPGLEKFSLPGMQDLKLGKTGDLKNTDWVKTDLPRLGGQANTQIPQEVGEYTELLKDPSNIDQTIDSKAAQMSEFQSLNNETKELAAMKELPKSMLADLKRYQDAQAPPRRAGMKAEAKEVAIKKATDYFAGQQDKLSQAQGMMSKLKKKYSYVPDSRDLSTARHGGQAVKATSLKDEPLKKRLVFGLGFQIQRTNPISVDLSPNLLYKFNKLFSAGISGTYRASLGIENNSSPPRRAGVSTNTTTNVYGASAIVQHKLSFAKGSKILKGFFGHGEFQYLRGVRQFCKRGKEC